MRFEVNEVRSHWLSKILSALCNARVTAAGALSLITLFR